MLMYSVSENLKNILIVLAGSMLILLQMKKNKRRKGVRI